MPAAPAPEPAASTPAPAPPSSEPTFTTTFGVAAPTPAPAAHDAAPIPNGDFESADGWQGANSQLTVIDGGVTGKAVRVSRAARSDSFAIVAKALDAAKPGTNYRAGAYVRSLTPGMFVCLRVEELPKRGGLPITSERCRPAAAGWQRLRVSARSTAKNSRLVVSVRVIAALGGTSFDVDGFKLR
jgi:hypothetical protein